MKNILQAIKSCLNGLRVYVDKITAKLATQEEVTRVKGLAETAQATAERQADWNENSSDNVSHVKNRTHYKNIIHEYVCFEGTLPSFTSTEAPLDIDIPVGTGFTIYYNGAVIHGNNPSFSYINGDGWVVNPTPDFSIIHYNNTKTMSIWNGVGDGTIKIVAWDVPVLKQLDEEYIPDTIARTSHVDEKMDATKEFAEESANNRLKIQSIPDAVMPSGVWTSTAYGNGKFVAVSSWGTVAYSEDGITWTQVDTPLSLMWNHIAYGSNKFVVITKQQSGILCSTNGLDWVVYENALPIGNYGETWTSIAYGNDKFVAVSHDGIAVYSYDGITWEKATMPVPKEDDDLLSVAYGNGKFIAVTDNYAICYSEDGITWNREDNVGIGYGHRGLAYGNGKFVTLPTSDSTGASYSEDGLTWTNTTISENSHYWTSIVYGNDKFVALSPDGIATYSYDGITWIETSIPVGSWHAIAYGNNRFVAIDKQDDKATYSYDGITWYSEGYDIITQNDEDVTNAVKDILVNPNFVTEEYVDGKIEDAKPDWDQYDSTAKDYVKNRTHYKTLQTDEKLFPTKKINVEELGVGTHLIFKPSNVTHFKRWYDFSLMRYARNNGEFNYAFGQYYEYTMTASNYHASYDMEPEMLLLNSKYNLIDDKNYSFPSMVGVTYVIIDTTVLSEENKQLFPEIGIYLTVQEDSTKTDRALIVKVFRIDNLSEVYIPGTIARTNYVDDKIAKLKSVASTSAYTNQLLLATDTDRTTIYNGDGYIDGYRLSSSGSISAQDGMSTTGFIPATPGQTIRIKGAVPMQGQNNYLITYNADNTVSKYASMAYDSTGWITPADGWMQYENGVIIIPLTSELFGTDFNAVRFCSAQLSDDVIVTVDEEIADPYVQPDWDQNDSTAKDYVKNRTHWCGLQLPEWLNHYDEVNPITAGIGVHPLVIAKEGKEDFSFDRFLAPEYLRTILSLKITFTSGGYGDMDFTKGFFNTAKFIDDYNYKSLTNSVQGYEFYCIRDVTALSEQYREMFTANGAYLRVFEGTGELKASRVAFRCLKFNQLDERYIPDTIARTADVIPLPPTASVGQTIKVSAVDANGKPTEWKAVDFQEGKWRLVADVRLTEDTATIEITQDTEGNAFALKEYLLIGFVVGAAENTKAGSLYANALGKNDKTNRIANLAQTVPVNGDKITISCYGKVCGNRLRVIFGRHVDGSSETNAQMYTMIDNSDLTFQTREFDSIRNISLSTNVAGYGAGTILELWGVDA